MTSHQVTTSVKLKAVSSYLVRHHVKNCSLCCFLSEYTISSFLHRILHRFPLFVSNWWSGDILTDNSKIGKKRKQNDKNLMKQLNTCVGWILSLLLHYYISISQLLSWNQLVCLLLCDAFAETSGCDSALYKQHSVHCERLAFDTASHWGFLTLLTNARCARRGREFVTQM